MSELYQLKNDTERDRTWIWAREPKHIIELVKYYRKRHKRSEGSYPDGPEFYTWVQKVPTLDDIAVIQTGTALFLAGLIDTTKKGNLLDCIMEVTSDFTVQVNSEGLPYFDMYRHHVLAKGKRCNLYKFECGHQLIASKYFMPEDLIKAIADYDLSPHYKAAEATLKRIEGLRHPNLHVSVKRKEGKKPKSRVFAVVDDGSSTRN